MSTLDARGEALVIGDSVIYPSRRGTTLTLTEGMVTDILSHCGITSVKVRRTREAFNYGEGMQNVLAPRIVTVGVQQLVRVAA